MVEFSGQDRCQIDANGRIRLTPRFAAEFERLGAGVMLHLHPEGALGVYPQAVWETMAQQDDQAVRQSLTDVRLRRTSRTVWPWTEPERVSNQGRITIPHAFRAILGLEPGAEAAVVGCGYRLEIWNSKRWEDEMRLVLEHERRRTEVQMAAELRQPDPGP
jgi:MraZ protein